MPRIAVYSGSFDPITNGHLDIIRRASRVFDHVIVAVADNSGKNATFTVSERVRMIDIAIRDIPSADVDSFKGLLVDYLKKKKARVVVRGIRAVSDMDYEFQMASMNRQLFPEMETVFMMPADNYTYLSSSMIKDVARRGAKPGDYLPANVLHMLKKKLHAPKPKTKTKKRKR
ncbi:MAG: pantetheine-phosphate adenylyltransferase [Elusimicrobia bacterium]|nr:MAG: pantetheine-phosphate adenylyltransferase [Elusimicrobiota bacterium]